MAITPVTAEEIISTPPEVVLSDLPLEGQPTTDRGYVTEGGTKIRARLVTIQQQATRAPVNGDDVAIAPSGFTLSLTLAHLNDDHSVATDANGAFVIMDRHEVGFSDEAFKNPNFDPQAAIEAELRQQAYLLEQRVGRRAAAASYLAQHWGGAEQPAPPPLDMTPPVFTPDDPSAAI